MKKIVINLLFLVLGIGLIASVIIFEIDGMLGWFMATIGVFLIFLSLVVKSKQPLKNIMEFFSSFF